MICERVTSRKTSRANGGTPSLGSAVTRLVSTGIFEGSVYQPVPLPPEIRRFLRQADADMLRTVLAESLERLSAVSPQPPIDRAGRGFNRCQS